MERSCWEFTVRMATLKKALFVCEGGLSRANGTLMRYLNALGPHEGTLFVKGCVFEPSPD